MMDDHVATDGMQRLRHGGAEAAGTPGDQYGLCGEGLRVRLCHMLPL